MFPSFADEHHKIAEDNEGNTTDNDDVQSEKILRFLFAHCCTVRFENCLFFILRRSRRIVTGISRSQQRLNISNRQNDSKDSAGGPFLI